MYEHILQEPLNTLMHLAYTLDSTLLDVSKITYTLSRNYTNRSEWNDYLDDFKIFIKYATSRNRKNHRSQAEYE